MVMWRRTGLGGDVEAPRRLSDITISNIGLGIRIRLKQYLRESM